jgi:hypothetical protein
VAAFGVTTVSGRAAASDVVAAAAGVLAVSAGVGTVAAGAGVGAISVPAGSAGAVALGVVGATAGALAVSAAGGTAAGGAEAAAGTVGVTTGFVASLVTVAAGTAEAAAGVLVSAGAGIVAAGTAAAAGGGITVSAGALIEAAGAAAAAAQCSEIMLSEVTEKLLSAVPEVDAALAFCPMRVTSWPRCGLRSTALVVILKLWPVLSSINVKLLSEPPRQPLMLVGSELLLAVGVCANPSATSRAGATNNRHGLFMKSSEDSRPVAV